jgi:hypothetical protein
VNKLINVRIHTHTCTLYIHHTPTPSQLPHMHYTFTIHPRLHTTTTHSQTVSFPFETVCALETNRQIFSPFRSAYRRLGAPALPTDIKDFVKDAPYPATIEVPKGSIRLGDVMAVMRYSVYTMHSRKRSSHTRLSYTPPIRSSHTLLSYAPLIHASHTLLSYTPLIHSLSDYYEGTPFDMTVGMAAGV